MGGRRLLGLGTAGALLVVAVFLVRTLLGLAHLTRENPLTVLGDIAGGSKSSTVTRSVQSLRRVNIAVYGYGGPGHDGAYLTDSIMVISIQPHPTGPPSVAEISIPRDWFVPIVLGGGRRDQGRINQAYADGMSGMGPLAANDPAAGAAVANPTLSSLLGITIDHWVGVDFQAFRAAVDAVGGVDINVPNSFTDYQYPAGECNGQRGQNCAYMTVRFRAGMQHMNGTTALEFTRSRHSLDNNEGTDFARSRRQQLVVAALKSKVVSLGGLGNLPDLLNSLGDNVVTDLHVNDLQALYGLLKDVSTASVLHISFDDTNFLYECGYPTNCGAAYLYSHDRTYQQIAHYVSSVFVDPAALAEHAPVTIEDGSGRGVGASARWSSLLNMLSLQTADGGTARRTLTTQVIDRSGGRDARTAAWLAKFFGVTVTEEPPATATPVPGTHSTPLSTPSTDGGVLVILGSTEETAFLGNPGVGR